MLPSSVPVKRDGITFFQHELTLLCCRCGAISQRIHHPDGRQIAVKCALCGHVAERRWLPNVEAPMPEAIQSAPSPAPLLPRNTLQELHAARMIAAGSVKRARRSGGPSWLDRLLTRWTDAAARRR